MTKQRKKVLILASAGLDSTYLLEKSFKEGNSTSIVSIFIGNNENKVLVEKNQLKLIKKYFEKRNLYFDRTNEIDFEARSNNNLILKQFPAWIIGSIFSICEIDEVWFGYCMNDDMISFLPEFEKVWNSYRPFVENLPKIKFPISKFKKENYINKIDNGLFQLTFSCENPVILKDKIFKFEDCGHCDSCEKNKYLNIFDRWNRNKNKSSETAKCSDKELSFETYSHSDTKNNLIKKKVKKEIFKTNSFNKIPAKLSKSNKPIKIKQLS